MIKNALVQVKVDYYYTCNGVQARNELTMVVGQDPNKRPPEDFVLNYLRRRHPGCDIEIISMDWL